MTTDPRPQLAYALDQLGDLVTTTDPTDSGDATPCADYNVEQLIGHVLAVVRRIGVAVSGRPLDGVPRALDSTDWAADWTAERAVTDAALAKADLSLEITVPWGRVSLGNALGAYIGETTVHSWDLAAATGRVDRLDPALAEGALAGYQAMVPASPRGGPIPFGPVVEVSPDADTYQRLAAWTGRDPAFESIVNA